MRALLLVLTLLSLPATAQNRKTFFPGSSSSSSTSSGITLGTYGSSPNSSGASLTDGTLTLQPASATQPGGVTTGTQTFAGAKTFSSAITTPGLTSSTQATVTSSGSSTGTAVGVVLDNATTLNTSGDVRLSLRSGGSEYSQYTFDGTHIVAAAKLNAKTIFNCSSGSDGTIIRVTGTGGTNTGILTKVCICVSDGAASPTFRWRNVFSGAKGSATNDCPATPDI